MMILARFLVFLSAVCLVFGKTKFIARHCDDPKSTNLATLNSAHISPYPVKIPGRLNVEGEAMVHQKLDPTKKYDLSLDLSRYFLFGYIHVPCVGGVGSCTLDLCSTVAKVLTPCPEEFIKNGVPCRCEDLEAKTYTVKGPIDIGDKLVKSSLVFGDYKADVKLLDHDTKEMLACFHIETTIEAGKDACTNIFCDIIGK